MEKNRPPQFYPGDLRAMGRASPTPGPDGGAPCGGTRRSPRVKHEPQRRGPRHSTSGQTAAVASGAPVVAGITLVMTR